MGDQSGIRLRVGDHPGIRLRVTFLILLPFPCPQVPFSRLALSQLFVNHFPKHALSHNSQSNVSNDWHRDVVFPRFHPCIYYLQFLKQITKVEVESHFILAVSTT